jgi:linoleoyl-CoA desaturase
MSATFDRMTPQDSEHFATELDALYQQHLADRGAADRSYLLRLLRIRRALEWGGRLLMLASLACLPQWSHAWASSGAFWCVLLLGTLALSVAKILDNMEIGHNIMHGQWDWMNDPTIRSDRWEWDHACPAAQWRHSHNVEHHTWTNVLGMDRDVGYGMLRVTKHQRWHPFYLLQPLNIAVMALFFEWFIALHDLNIAKVLKGRQDSTKTRAMLAEIGQKARRQILKDYVLWPLLAGPFFVIIFGANAAANILRNVWTFIIIFCGHFPAGVHHFRKAEIAGESRGQWYHRQILGSCNIRGGRLFHIMSGNLSHQIEHHLFPDLPSNRYPLVAPKVEEICQRYGVPYNAAGLSRQLGTTMGQLFRLTLPSATRRRPQVA